VIITKGDRRRACSLVKWRPADEMVLKVRADAFLEDFFAYIR